MYANFQIFLIPRLSKIIISIVQNDQNLKASNILLSCNIMLIEVMCCHVLFRLVVTWHICCVKDMRITCNDMLSCNILVILILK
jgi:hypothetical protein